MRKLFHHARRILRRGAPEVAEEAVDISVAFDPAFYLSQFDANARPLDPQAHFLSVGWTQGMDPSAVFSVRGYLTANPDVAEAAVNPLVHFVRFGRAEGRISPPSTHTQKSNDNPASSGQDAETALADEIADEMDFAFYKAVAGLQFPTPRDAARHYLSKGHQLGLDPTPGFSAADYLRLYPDVGHADLLPFVHYIRRGRAEGRRPVDPIDDVASALASVPDLPTMEVHWAHGQAEIEALPRREGARRIRDAIPKTCTRLVFSITHDDFTSVRGGIQLCVGQEMALAAQKGVAYLAIHPVVPRPRLAPRGDNPAVWVTIGDTRIGPVDMETVQDVARHYADKARADVVIHALLGHAPEAILSLAQAAGAERLFAWLHDSFFLCPSFALQRNLVTYCGAPPPESSACKLCLFGQERRDHLDRLNHMVRAIPTHAIAPSKPALDIVASRGNMAFDAVSVVPHMDLSEGGARTNGQSGPTRIAFVGAPSRRKGYHVFREVARRNLGRDDLRFLYFGSAQHREPGVPTIPVDVTPDRPDAMVEALRAEGVDFVIHWAQFIETFSFATVEAMQAGADVLTHPGSGNVAALVRQTGRGQVLPNADALQAFLQPETLAKATWRRRATPRASLIATPSALSFEVLDAAQDPLLDEPIAAEGRR